MRSIITITALMGFALPLAAYRDVSTPIEAATAVEVEFDEAVPRRHPGAVRTYSLETIVSREAVEAIAEEQLYAFVHVTRCADRNLIAVAEARLGQIDLMDFDGLRGLLDKDASERFRLTAKFSSPVRLRPGEACVAFNGGGYSGGEAFSRPIPVAVRRTQAQ